MANVQAASVAGAGGATNTPGRTARSEGGRRSFGEVLQRAKPEGKAGARERKEVKGSAEGELSVGKKQGARKAAGTNGKEKAKADKTEGSAGVNSAGKKSQVEGAEAEGGSETGVVTADGAKGVEVEAVERMGQAEDGAAVVGEVVGEMTEEMAADEGSGGVVNGEAVEVEAAESMGQAEEGAAVVAGEGGEVGAAEDVKEKEEACVDDEAEGGKAGPASAKAEVIAQAVVAVEKQGAAVGESGAEQGGGEGMGERAGSNGRAVVEVAEEKAEKGESKAGEGKQAGGGKGVEAAVGKAGQEEGAAAKGAGVQFRMEEPVKGDLAAPAAPAARAASQGEGGGKASVAGGASAGPGEAAANDAVFAEANYPRIVTAVRGQMLPNGGRMQIRLEPPELGALQVQVEMRDGVLSASFQTSNDEATRLLSHSLHELKSALESQGVSVQKLQVVQAPREKDSGEAREEGQGQQESQGRASEQEQQRREMLQRMWRRLRGGRDALDVMG